MTIKLYTCLNENNKLNKELSNELSLDGTLRDSTSIINPVFNIEIENPTLYNYCYIESFNRYYFISDITSVRNNLWQITCNVDVLMSAKDSISQLIVILANSEVIENDRYLQRNTWVATVKTLTDIITFPNGLLDDGEFILITAGGNVAV